MTKKRMQQTVPTLQGVRTDNHHAAERNLKLFLGAIKALQIPLQDERIEISEIKEALAKDGADSDEIIVIEAVLLDTSGGATRLLGTPRPRLDTETNGA